MSLHVYFSESRIRLPIIIHWNGEIIVIVWSLDEYAYIISQVSCKAYQDNIKSISTSITWNVVQ
jgi:ABC-type bacteriocin/lantibiotic exporter with double-glycine peptidase domain